MKQFNPLNCPETFTILSLIVFVGLLVTIISVTILLFRQLGTATETMEIARDEIKDSVVEFINSKKGGKIMDIFEEMKIKQVSPEILPEKTFNTFIKPVINTNGTIEVPPEQIHPFVNIFWSDNSDDIFMRLDYTSICNESPDFKFNNGQKKNANELFELLNYMLENKINMIIFTRKCSPCELKDAINMRAKTLGVEKSTPCEKRSNI